MFATYKQIFFIFSVFCFVCALVCRLHVCQGLETIKPNIRLETIKPNLLLLFVLIIILVVVVVIYLLQV